MATPPRGSELNQSKAESAPTNNAEKLELLLEAFRRPDGKRWALREIEEATEGSVSASYLSSIRGGRIKKVGARQRQHTARVMGFPERLWDAEPEQWPDILEENRRRRAAGEASQASVAELLENLFHYARHPLTGTAFTEASVAELSDGALDETEVRAIRQGREPNPPDGQLLALSEVFGVDLSYWYGPGTQPLLDPATAKFLSGPRRLRALHMDLLNLPRGDRDRITDLIEDALDQTRRSAAQDDAPSTSHLGGPTDEDS